MKVMQTMRAGVLLRSLPITLLLFLLTLHTLLRIALLAYTGTVLVPPAYWPAVLVKGLWFDLVVASVLVAPVLLYEAAIPNRWRNARVHQKLRGVWLFVFVSLLLFEAVSEFTFWIEFSNRLNFIALDYLIYTSEVVRNVIESYPIVMMLTAIGVIALAVTWWLTSWCHALKIPSLQWRQRLAILLAAIALPTLLLTLASVDQIDGSKNTYADELSGNGLFTLAAAARRNELDYLKFYRTLPPQTAAQTLSKLGVVRHWPAEHKPTRAAYEVAARPDNFRRTPKNLVLISVESLSASYLGAYGSVEKLTPRLDALAKEGWLFTQVYATGTRTVRGLEALSLGTPPVPGQAIVRRPDNAHLTTLGGVLAHQGFDTFFFYGGYGYFDNMNAYFSANDYQVIDRTDIPSKRVVFENVWGVADEVLFDTVIDRIDSRATTDRPFFAHVMTTSNHRPYTYPQGRIDIPSPGGRAGAVKYTDYAIGKFIEDAKTQPWFKDTLFVIVADHCASVAGKTRLPVKNYQIPLIMYSPGNLKPGKYSTMISQIDIVPSLIEVLAQKNGELFFGRSIFGHDLEVGRAFISNYQELGYLKNNKLTVLSPKRRVQAFDIDPQSFEATASTIDDQLLAEAIAYYQTASVDFRDGKLRAPYYAPESP